MALASGTKLGAYEVIAAIGAGGMGEVYRARDTRLGRDVALKVLPAALHADADRLRRFTLEAQTAGALNHPNVLTVYEVGDDNGRPFLAAELLEGETLREKLGVGPLPVSKAVDYARQAAAGLAAAHARHIVHRDIKPDNLFITKDGRLKILDFGLAKAAAPVDSAQGNDGETRIADTAVGTVLGTVGYMSPEQVRGLPVDARSDLFNLGIVLYEMLSGTRPFTGDSAVQTMNAILTEDAPALSTAGRTLPTALEPVVRHCLEKQPDERFQSARDLAFALQAVTGTGSAATAAIDGSPGRASRLPFAAMALAAVVVGAAGMWIVPRALYTGVADAARPPVGLTVSPPADAPLLIDTDMPDLAIASDGRAIVYQSRRTDPDGVRLASTMLARRDLGSFETAALTNLGFFPQGPFLSSDSAWVGFQTTAGAKVAPVLARAPIGGGPMEVLLDLAELGPLRGAFWTGDEIVFATSRRAHGLMRIGAGGGTPVEITTPKEAAGERDHVWPAPLPDGRGLLFAISREGRRDVAVLPAGADTWRVLIEDATAPRYLASGHLIFVRGGVLYGAGFDLAGLSITTEPVALVKDVLTKGTGAADAAISANGTLTYVAGVRAESRHRFLWVDRAGMVKALPLDPRDYDESDLSRDGRFIAVTVQERGTPSIWVYDIARDTFTRVTRRDAAAQSPVWSPAGDRLAYWSAPERSIVVMPADGSGTPVPLARSEAGRFYPHAWSPADGTIAFVKEEPSVQLQGVSTTAPFTVRPLATGGTMVEASFSPDGKWIAHIAFDGTNPEVVVGPAASADRRWPVAARGRYPKWNPNGREVLFRDGDTIQSIAIDPATGQPIGRVTKVIDLPPRLAAIRALDISPDGKRFLMLERVDTEAPAPQIRVVLNWLEEVRTKMAAAKRVGK